MNEAIKAKAVEVRDAWRALTPEISAETPGGLEMDKALFELLNLVEES